MGRIVRVEVWTDVQCVWCYVGDARWKRAISMFGGTVDVVHRSFELQPGFPVDFDAQEYLQAQRGLSAAEQARVFASMTRVAAEEGLAYAPERIRPTNSHLAMEVLHYAETVGRGDEVRDRLYAAYFVEGRHIGMTESLLELAAEAGLDPDPVRAELDAGTYRAAVNEDSAAARALGVQGVPFAVIDEVYTISGAQRTEALVEALQRASGAGSN
ncbi:DsbA family oxidoreductase [Micromonospora ureilytica]|uniref:DsbA family oxidoreductase n=1 Tax=Micromonospora ureilytica TaxID=709868 RepID=UPI0040392924